MAQCMKPSFETILSMLRRAKSDNEKFASLLVLSRIRSANDLTEDERKHVFETVGFSFPIRLLTTSCVDERTDDSKSVVYAALGSSVLSAFCTNDDVVKGNDIFNAVPHVLKVIEKYSDRFFENELAGQAVNDCLDYLIVLSHHKDHLQKLIALNVLDVICSLDIVAISKSSELLLLLLNLCPQLWLKSGTWDLLTNLSCNFKQNQESRKFQLCGIIHGLVFSIPLTFLHQFGDFDLSTWRENVLEGCKQILCSKVTVPQRQSALMLVSTTVSLFDVDSCFKSIGYMFFIVVVRLSCIEIGLLQKCLENNPVDSLVGLRKEMPVAIACYRIVEIYCVEVADFERSNKTDLTFEQIQIVQSSLDDVARCCAKFVESALQKIDNLPQQDLYFVHSTIRFLGSYLNVDYHIANNTEMLPVLLKILHYITSAPKENFHLFNYIAPAIMISLENEETRTPFLHEDVISSLLQLLQYFYSEDNASPAATMHLVIQIIIAICTFCTTTLEKVLSKVLSTVLNQKLESVHEKIVPWTCTLLVVLLNKQKYCDFLQINRSMIKTAIEQTLQIIKRMLEDKGNGQKYDLPSETRELWTICIKELIEFTKRFEWAQRLVREEFQSIHLPETYGALGNHNELTILISNLNETSAS